MKPLRGGLISHCLWGLNGLTPGLGMRREGASARRMGSACGPVDGARPPAGAAAQGVATSPVERGRSRIGVWLHGDKGRSATSSFPVRNRQGSGTVRGPPPFVRAGWMAGIPRSRPSGRHHTGQTRLAVIVASWTGGGIGSGSAGVASACSGRTDRTVARSPRSSARRSDRPKRRRASLRASVSSDRSAQDRF
jgi:hypothetical protein